jgi:hypothetical protein
MVIDEEEARIRIQIDSEGEKEERRKGGPTRRVQQPVKHKT